MCVKFKTTAAFRCEFIKCLPSEQISGRQRHKDFAPTVHRLPVLVFRNEDVFLCDHPVRKCIFVLNRKFIGAKSSNVGDNMNQSDARTENKPQIDKFNCTNARTENKVLLLPNPYVLHYFSDVTREFGKLSVNFPG